jgi:hypothetical protein
MRPRSASPPRSDAWLARYARSQGERPDSVYDAAMISVCLEGIDAPIFCTRDEQREDHDAIV